MLRKAGWNPATKAVHLGFFPHRISRTRRLPGSGPELTAYCILDAQTHLSTVHVQNRDVKFTDGQSRFLSAPAPEPQACPGIHTAVGHLKCSRLETYVHVYDPEEELCWGAELDRRETLAGIWFSSRMEV